jgi:hypothetical protein
MVLGGCRRAERQRGRERRWGVQKPLAADQGKTVPGVVLLVAVGRSVPGGPVPLVGEIPGSGRQRAGGKSKMTWTMSRRGTTPAAKMRWPRKSSSEMANPHFSWLRARPLEARMANNAQRWV